MLRPDVESHCMAIENDQEKRSVDHSGDVRLASQEFAEQMRSLLDLNYQVIESLAGKSFEDESQIWSLGLAKKLFGHAVTGFQLWQEGTSSRLFEVELRFVDYPSIQVLTRACTESLIAYNYVFVDPIGDQDLAESRFLAWMIAGYTQRESFVEIATPTYLPSPMASGMTQELMLFSSMWT